MMMIRMFLTHFFVDRMFSVCKYIIYICKVYYGVRNNVCEAVVKRSVLFGCGGITDNKSRVLLL